MYEEIKCVMNKYREIVIKENKYEIGKRKQVNLYKFKEEPRSFICDEYNDKNDALKEIKNANEK